MTPGGTVPVRGRWFGIYLHAKERLDIRQLSHLSAYLALLPHHTFYVSIAFLFFEDGLDGRALTDLGEDLRRHDWHTGGRAKIAWIPHTRAIAPVASLTMMPVRDGRVRAVRLDAPEIRPLVPLGLDDTQPSLRLVPLGGAMIDVTTTPGDDGLMLVGRGGIGLARGTAGAGPGRNLFEVPPGAPVELPIAGPATGCLQASGALLQGVTDLLVGMQFDLTANGAPELSGPLVYPLMNDANAIRRHPATVQLCPFAPLDPGRTAFTLDPAGPGFASALRTRRGAAITLGPVSDGSSRLVLNRDNAGLRYLTPDGAFAARLPEGADEEDLLCGLSGVEHIGLRPGDRFVFAAGRPAAATMTLPGGATGPDGAVFATDEDGAATSAWMTVRAAHDRDGGRRAYCAAPDRSPFFAASAAAGDPLRLDYLPLSRVSLGAGDPATAFPVVPYAALSATPGPGRDPDLVRAFEFGFLAPKRRSAIMAGSAAREGVGAAAGSGRTHAVTPQGYKATFEDGRWTALDIASMTGPGTEVSIRFAADPGEALPDALQDAFLTNQQFVVIVRDGGNLGRFAPKITLGGWGFDLDLSANTTVGSYRNVLIFKSANTSLAQLAATPSAWTARQAFNMPDDPDGAYLSRWLVAYLDEARRLHDGGKGVASLAPFCALIDDPEWNGLLALNVAMDPAQLAPEIEALLAGIDAGGFVAHHIGTGANRMTADTAGDIELTSAPFALIHYADPAWPSTDGDIAYLDSPDDYDFRLLALEAVFENAELTHFSNRSLIAANRLFGDPVLHRAPSGGDARNALLLHGSYRQDGGVPCYSFATAPGLRGEFFLSGDAFRSVTLTGATMSVAAEPAAGGGTAYRARFDLSGSLHFHPAPAFDLLSFERLSFQGLAIDMHLSPAVDRADAVRPRLDRSFAFRTGNMAFDDRQVRQIEPGQGAPPDTDANLVRAGSLVATFPLKLSGFRTAPDDTSPESLGYRVLATTEPEGIRSPDLSQGPWHALAFDVTLGSKGALASKAVIAAELLLAWRPGGAGAPFVAPLFRLSGPEGLSLGLDIQGVIGFSAQDVILNRIGSSADSGKPAMFVMSFESIGFSVLALSFPPAGTTNLYLMGGLDDTAGADTADPTLGWIGGYRARDAGT
jgi:hypothetical protein